MQKVRVLAERFWDGAKLCMQGEITQIADDVKVTPQSRSVELVKDEPVVSPAPTKSKKGE